ncbi:MAG: hypothetical protein HRU12_20480 [Phaeodactylibacter sp.]|nr:hypothetical protein [Phaeodactylibacter sp.]
MNDRFNLIVLTLGGDIAAKLAKYRTLKNIAATHMFPTRYLGELYAINRH